jgi:WD40 repeat protein
MEVCCKGTRVAVVAFQRAYIPPTAGSRVTLLDLATGKKHRLSPKAFELSPMAYSPDGTKLALTVGRSVKVYSVDQGRYIGTLQVEGRLADLVFSPDGRFLAALGDKLRIWRCPE